MTPPTRVVARRRTSTDNSDVEWMAAEDPLFILYTRSQRARPSCHRPRDGRLHTRAGHSFRTVFDAPIRADDVWFCTRPTAVPFISAAGSTSAITGHTYVAYGPLLKPYATQIVFEGVPSWPDVRVRLWRIVDQHKVTHLYTAPTAIRALMRSARHPSRWTSRASLKLLGSKSASRSTPRPGGRTARSWATTAEGAVVRFAASCCFSFRASLVRICRRSSARRASPAARRRRALRRPTRGGRPRRGDLSVTGRWPTGADPHKPGAAMTPVAGCVPALLDAATGAEIPAVIGEEAKGQRAEAAVAVDGADLLERRPRAVREHVLQLRRLLPDGRRRAAAERTAWYWIKARRRACWPSRSCATTSARRRSSRRSSRIPSGAFAAFVFGSGAAAFGPASWMKASPASVCTAWRWSGLR